MTSPSDTNRPVVHKGTVGEDDLDEIGGSAADADADDPGDHDAPEDEVAPEAEARIDAHDGVILRTPKQPRPPRRSGAGRTAVGLALAGGGLWAAVALVRCQRNAPLPPAVVTDAPLDDAATPEPAIGDEAPPIPEGTRSRPRDEAPEADDGPEPSTTDVPRVRDDWAADLEPPTVVSYTIRRGGTLENVANLFKIFHHEITALNPGVALEQELAPNTRVVLYRRKAGEPSESVGFPSGGSLAGGVPMVEGKGRRILAIGWKTWGTDATIAILDRVLDRWAAAGHAQPILVGNISNRTGGKLEPHSTHQSGRDVDLGYPQKLAKGAELNWQEMTAQNLDAAETWALLRILADTGAVEEIYIDRSIQKLLHEYAVANDVVPERSLSKWMEYPRPTGQADAWIKHVAGHTDHLHVRFACPKSQPRCKSRS